MSRGGRRSADRPGRHPHVLVAENEESVRRPCARYLSLFGFHVEEAANGEEAVAAWQTDRPHVVVADARLQRGSDLAPRLATESGGPFIITVTDDYAPVPPGSVRDPAQAVLPEYHARGSAPGACASPQRHWNRAPHLT